MADLPDGVYLGLSADDYFGQPRMGSSDWIRLHKTRHGWWWQSRWNPDRAEPKSREFLLYGSALHALLLEGVEAYERAFAVAPDKAAFPGVLVTTEDIKNALARAGFDLSGTSKFTKKDWAREARIHLPSEVCWDNLLADFEGQLEVRRAAGKPVETISAADDRMLRLMHKIALDPDRTDNQEVRRLLAPDVNEHPTLAEVSVFATLDGVARRWRIDRMYPGLDMDLKSLGNWRGRPLAFEVGEVLARNGWDIQRADYHIGRTEAYRLISEGKLYGGSVEQRRYIEQIVAENPTWDWIWLVYQKPDGAGRAPVILPLMDLSWQVVWEKGQPSTVPSDLRTWGERKLFKAIEFYKTCVDTFGLEQPWAFIEPLHFTDEQHANTVRLPDWIRDTEPSATEAFRATEGMAQ